jgi:AmmeMemoRadiSam system protein B
MAPRPNRPAIRPVESIVLPDPTHGRVVVLRDTQGVTSVPACIPQDLIPIVARFTGELTCAEIAEAVSLELGEPVTRELVTTLADALDRALYLEGPTYQEALARVKQDFHDAAARPASHAGGAYSSDPAELALYLDDRCLARGRPHPAEGKAPPARAPLTALIAPHIDPWRGAVGYGHAYAALRAGLAAEADTFIVFGTSHAPMAEPFALCRKAFDTPLGPLPADVDALDRIAARCPYDPYTDELNHKREHSIEFQAVFLKHLLGDRPAQIVPILAGLGRHQARGTDPSRDRKAMALLDAVRELVAERGRRVVVIAGADLAHVGPRFGDRRPFDAGQRAELAATDGASLALATAADAAGFWRQVASDLETRRVCGLSPIFALLSTMPQGSVGEVGHYEQTVDAEDGSIVSHAAVAFFG